MCLLSFLGYLWHLDRSALPTFVLFLLFISVLEVVKKTARNHLTTLRPDGSWRNTKEAQRLLPPLTGIKETTGTGPATVTKMELLRMSSNKPWRRLLKLLQLQVLPHICKMDR